MVLTTSSDFTPMVSAQVGEVALTILVGATPGGPSITGGTTGENKMRHKKCTSQTKGGLDLERQSTTTSSWTLLKGTVSHILAAMPTWFGLQLLKIYTYLLFHLMDFCWWIGCNAFPGDNEFIWKIFGKALCIYFYNLTIFIWQKSQSLTKQKNFGEHQKFSRRLAFLCLQVENNSDLRLKLRIGMLTPYMF